MVQYQNPYLTNPYLVQNPYQPVIPSQTYQQPVDGIVKVNGRESAMQYQLPPNSTSPALFDIDAVSASLGRRVCVDGTCIGRQ